MPPPDLPLSTGTVARMLHVSAATILNWVWSGKLAAYATPGGHYRISRKELLHFLRSNSIPLPAEFEAEGARRVLVVEDDPGVVEVVRRAFAEANGSYLLEVATNGFEAGLKAAEFRPDLVVLDIRLPGMDGFAVCRRIKAHAATRGAQVLAITGYPSPEVREKMFACGAEGFLAKPFSVEELLREAERLLAAPPEDRAKLTPAPPGRQRARRGREGHAAPGGEPALSSPPQRAGPQRKGPSRSGPAAG